MKTPLVSEPLGRQHSVEAFDCGRPEFSRWLKGSAAHAQSNRTARTFVWHTGDRRVVAYFSLAAHLVERGEFPHRIGRGSPEQIPAVLLARLALDRNLQGEGLASQLLVDATQRTITASDSVGVRFLVVDAIDDTAAQFYVHHGFVRLPSSLRLARKLSDLEAAFR